MGWLRYDGHPDDEAHEGYITTVVQEGGIYAGWRELGLDDVAVSCDDILGVYGPTAAERRTYRMQIACTCGWRSHRMHIPIGVEWSPATLWLSVVDDDTASTLWARQHRDLIDDLDDSLWRSFERLATTR